MKEQKLIAYCLTDNLKTMKEKDVRVLDFIHVAFGLIKDGEVYWKEESGIEDISHIRKINPEIKIVLSIGGWEADGFSQAAETADGRNKWAESVVRLVEKYGFDGVDVDWEYPCSDKAGIRAISQDKENFTLLLETMRERLEDSKTLSIAAGALKSYLENTQMEKAAKFLDYVQLMTYDLCGEWDGVTGHHAGLYSYGEGTPNSDEIIRLFAQAGVPYEKMVMGAAFYSRGWKGVEGGKPGSPAAEIADVLSYGDIIKELETGQSDYRKYWDEDAKAAYLYNGSEFVTYEDARALQYKVKYVKEQEMFGLMYWEYGQDKTGRLTQFLRDQLDNVWC